MIFVLTLHSIVRWLVIITGLIAVTVFAIQLLKKQPYTPSVRRWSVLFSSLMDTQVLLGLIFFFWNGLLSPGLLLLRYRLEHLAIMLLATVVSHWASMQRNPKNDAQRLKTALASVLLALGMVVIGVSLLPGNRWIRITGLF